MSTTVVVRSLSSDDFGCHATRKQPVVVPEVIDRSRNREPVDVHVAQIDMKTDTTIRLSLKYSFSVDLLERDDRSVRRSEYTVSVDPAIQRAATETSEKGGDEQYADRMPSPDTIHAAAVGNNQRESTARTIARAAAHRMIGAPSLWIFILSQIGFQSVNIMLK